MGREAPIGNPKTKCSQLIEVEDNTYNEQIDSHFLREYRTDSWTDSCDQIRYASNMVGSCNQIWSAANAQNMKVVNWIFDCGARDTMSYDPKDFSYLSSPSKSHIETVSGELMEVKEGALLYYLTG